MRGGAILLLFRRELPLAIMPGNKVLGLQFSQGLNRPRDEDLVLPLLHSVDLGLYPIVDCKSHKSWDGP